MTSKHMLSDRACDATHRTSAGYQSRLAPVATDICVCVCVSDVQEDHGVQVQALQVVDRSICALLKVTYILLLPTSQLTAAAGTAAAALGDAAAAAVTAADPFAAVTVARAPISCQSSCPVYCHNLRCHSTNTLCAMNCFGDVEAQSLRNFWLYEQDTAGVVDTVHDPLTWQHGCLVLQSRLVLTAALDTVWYTLVCMFEAHSWQRVSLVSPETSCSDSALSMLPGEPYKSCILAGWRI